VAVPEHIPPPFSVAACFSLCLRRQVPTRSSRPVSSSRCRLRPTVWSVIACCCSAAQPFAPQSLTLRSDLRAEGLRLSARPPMRALLARNRGLGVRPRTRRPLCQATPNQRRPTTPRRRCPARDSLRPRGEAPPRRSTKPTWVRARCTPQILKTDRPNLAQLLPAGLGWGTSSNLSLAKPRFMSMSPRSISSPPVLEPLSMSAPGRREVVPRPRPAVLRGLSATRAGGRLY
jgi:hypothetical protein